jgi:glycine/D-amino acid oxidase-like deaminating enzyme
MHAHRRFASSVASCDWYHETGNLEWTADTEAQQELEHKVARLLEWGYQARWLDPKQVRSLEPNLAPDAIASRAACFPDEGWVDPTRLVSALLSMACASGAQVRPHCAAVGMSMTGERIHGVRTSDGETVRTDAVVNCAGPGAGEVAALAGVDLPMRNTAGLLAYTTPTAVAVGRVIHALQIHLRPAAGGRLVLGTRTADAAVPTPDEGSRIAEPGAAEAMLHLAEQLYPDLRDSRVQESRIGVRPIPIDGLPVLGPSATIENFHFAVTHSGVTLCLRVAELISAEVRGELVNELEPFRHSRLNARQPTKPRVDGQKDQNGRYYNDAYRIVRVDPYASLPPAEAPSLAPCSRSPGSRTGRAACAGSARTRRWLCVVRLRAPDRTDNYLTLRQCRSNTWNSRDNTSDTPCRKGGLRGVWTARAGPLQGG